MRALGLSLGVLLLGACLPAQAHVAAGTTYGYGPEVWLASPYPGVFYFDHVYWRYHAGAWFRASRHGGPWLRVVPRVVPAPVYHAHRDYRRRPREHRVERQHHREHYHHPRGLEPRRERDHRHHSRGDHGRRRVDR